MAITRLHHITRRPDFQGVIGHLHTSMPPIWWLVLGASSLYPDSVYNWHNYPSERALHDRGLTIFSTPLTHASVFFFFSNPVTELKGNIPGQVMHNHQLVQITHTFQKPLECAYKTLAFALLPGSTYISNHRLWAHQHTSFSCFHITAYTYTRWAKKK